MFFLEHHDKNQLSSWSRPFSDWDSRILCLLPHVKQKAKQMGGCSCPGSEVFFGARMFFFNIPLLLDKFEIMLNHGIVDELVVFSTYQRTAVKIHLQIYIFLLFTYIYIYIYTHSLFAYHGILCFVPRSASASLISNWLTRSAVKPPRGWTKLPMTWTASQFLC